MRVARKSLEGLVALSDPMQEPPHFGVELRAGELAGCACEALEGLCPIVVCDAAAGLIPIEQLESLLGGGDERSASRGDELVGAVSTGRGDATRHSTKLYGGR